MASYFGNTSDRFKNSGQTITRPESNGRTVVDWSPKPSTSDSRRNGDELSYDDWVAKQKANGWPDWFIRWAFPRENYDGTDEYKGFKNVLSTFGTIFGLGSLGSLWSNGSLFALGSLAGGERQSNRSSSNGIFNFLRGSGYSSDLMSILGGFGSQYASSLLNFENMSKLIDKQNEYNTPANQMARFAEAGLNPNLVYGLGSNGNQPSSGSIAPVDFDSSQREARLAKMQIYTQTKLADAEIGDKQASMQLKSDQSDLVRSQKANQDLQNSVYISNWKADMTVKFAEYREIINRINNDKQRVELERQLNDAQRAYWEVLSKTRSPLGQFGNDIILLMQGVDDMLNEIPLETPQDVGIPESKDQKQYRVSGSRVPPGYGGR